MSSSMADNITAVATVITALGGFVAVISVALPTLREARKAGVKAQEAVEKTREVHVMVNQQRTDARNYNNALIAALTAAGVDVPADQSLVLPGTDGPA